jgi:hypothetical protein
MDVIYHSPLNAKCYRSSGVEGHRLILRLRTKMIRSGHSLLFQWPLTIPGLDGRQRSGGPMHPLPDGNGSHHGKE